MCTSTFKVNLETHFACGADRLTARIEWAPKTQLLWRKLLSLGHFLNRGKLMKENVNIVMMTTVRRL